MRLFTTAIISIILFSAPAFAIKVVNVKNKQAILDLEGESVQVGDRLGARNAQGKAVGMLTIKQVKGNRAMATIDRGSAQRGNKVSTISSRGSSDGAKPSSVGKGTISSRSSWGGLVGMSMNNMQLKMVNSGVSSTADLTGTSFSLSGFYQLPLSQRIGVRLIAGYESLVAEGTSSAGGPKATVDLGYLGLNTIIKYNVIANDTMEIWGGAGLGFLYAMNKSSNVLETSKISVNQTLLVSLGADIRMGNNSFIPIQFDLAMFPDNKTSTARQMNFRAGWGWNF